MRRRTIRRLGSFFCKRSRDGSGKKSISTNLRVRCIGNTLLHRLPGWNWIGPRRPGWISQLSWQVFLFQRQVLLYTWDDGFYIIYIYTHATVFCCKIWIGPMGQVKRQQEIAQANTAAAKECLCFLRVQNTQIEAGILLRPWYFRTIYIGNQDLFDHSKMSKWAMKKTPWLLGYYIGDDILSSYEGIRIQQTIIRTPIKQPHSMESEVVLFPETVPGSRDTLRCGKRVPGTLSLEKKHGGITNFWIPS